MPEINIPGVTQSRYKTDELIDGLMRLERVPRDRADEQLQQYRNEQTAWRQLSRQVVALRDSARALYSYNNPFTEKIADSSDSSAVTVAVTREAQDQQFSVSVLQKAQADSFLSAEIPKDATVPAGKYVFAVGEKTIQFSWRGGSYPDFVRSLNRRGDGTIRAQMIQTAPGKRALLVESLKTGAEQSLRFEEAAFDLAVEVGILAEKPPATVDVSETEAQVAPGASMTISFSAPVQAADDFLLEYTVSSASAESAQAAVQTASRPELPLPGGITYEGITVTNAESETALPPMSRSVARSAAPAAASAALSLRTSSGELIPLPDIPQTGSQTFAVPLNEGTIDALVVTNTSADRSINLSDIRIFGNEQGGLVPANPVSRAQDAVVQYEGITITRPDNTIADLVPGVTLTVQGESERPVRINVSPDTETAKDAIIAFVANYNRVIAEINILTQNKPEVIEEIQYFTEEEREAAEEKLGLMQGETTLNTLKSALQRITSSSYTADDNSAYALLAQIGISTRATSGAGVDTSRLRGYLEIDEGVLDAALETSIASVKDLFGYDSDGDLVIDSGAALAIDNNTTPYVQTGGIFAARTAGLDTRITETERRITQLDQQLDQKEADLRRQYAQMEGALNRLESQSDSISNFNRRNSSRD